MPSKKSSGRQSGRQLERRAETGNESGADGLEVGRMTDGGTGDTIRHAAEV